RRGDVGLAAVQIEVAVGDELARLRARVGEAEPVDDVVEPGLEDAEEVLAGLALAPLGLEEVAPELALGDAVDVAGLLFLAQLERVLGDLAPPGRLRAGRVGPPLDGALGREAAVALEEELDALAAAEPADGVVVSGHAVCLLARPGVASVG